MKKPELLAPAGDMESLKTALHFGADAVYIGGRNYSMRAGPENFTMEQIAEAAHLAHDAGARLYVACNTLPRNDEIEPIAGFIRDAAQAGVDAFIISDMGIFRLARKIAPEVEIHISTQAGVTNYAAAGALFEMGASRVVLARELSLAEIAGIRRRTPEALEVETFVHGAMCVSFSGRCLLSSYMVGRDANRGQCAQPCRWRYTLYEEQHGRYFPMEENADGTYILNSRDLCMIAHIPALLEAGVSSLKIEGRAKSAYYVAVVTNAYRMAIDACCSQPPRPFDPRLLEEVKKASHREFCTGFYFGPLQKGQACKGGYMRGYDIVAVVEEQRGDIALCSLRNRLHAGDELEELEPGSLGRRVRVLSLYDENGEPLAQALHPCMRVLVRADEPLTPGALLRRRPNTAEWLPEE